MQEASARIVVFLEDPLFRCVTLFVIFNERNTREEQRGNRGIPGTGFVTGDVERDVDLCKFSDTARKYRRRLHLGTMKRLSGYERAKFARNFCHVTRPRR